MDCYTCRSVSGERRISPGPTIYEGHYWLIEHAYPTRLKGWLVIVLKRHVAALHELTREEFSELGELQALAVRLLHEALDSAKEYTVCFAEKEGFQHIHFHIVAIPRDLPDEFRGTKIFAMINVTEAEALPREEIRAFCEKLKKCIPGPQHKLIEEERDERTAVAYRSTPIRFLDWRVERRVGRRRTRHQHRPRRAG